MNDLSDVASLRSIIESPYTSYRPTEIDDSRVRLEILVPQYSDKQMNKDAVSEGSSTPHCADASRG